MVIFGTNKNLGTVINRIGNYIVKSQIFFRTSGAYLNLHNFVKIYSLFLFDDGTVDQEAIDILSTLCQKTRLKNYLEQDCFILFELSGKKKKIGVNGHSGLTYEQKRFLITALSIPSSVPTNNWNLAAESSCLPTILPMASPLSGETIIHLIPPPPPATPMRHHHAPISKPPFNTKLNCCRKRYSSLSRMAKSRIHFSVRKYLGQLLGPKRTQDDLDMLLFDLLSTNKKKYLSQQQSNPTPIKSYASILLPNALSTLRKRKRTLLSQERKKNNYSRQLLKKSNY